MNKVLIAVQAGLFYLIPYIIGRALTLLGRKRKTDDFNGQEKLKEPVVKAGEYFALGALSIFGLALFTKYALGAITTAPFEKIFFPLVWLGVIVSVLVVFFKRKREKTKLGFGIIALILVLSSAVYAFWYYKSPYSLNWDSYQHQTLARLIQKGEFSYFTTELSDTFGFDSYPPTFHLLVAISQFPAKLGVDEITTYWNIIGFYHLLTVGLASYILGLAVTKKREIAVLSVIVGTITFDSITSFTNLFILPQTVAAVVFILLFSNVIAGYKNKVKLPRFWLILSGVIFLILIHYLVGIFSAGVLLATYLYVRYQDKAKRVLKTFPFLYLLPVVVVAAIFAANFIDLSFLNTGEASLYLYETSEKAEFAQRVYGYALAMFVPAGIFYAISKKRWKYNFVLLLLFGFGGILYANFPYVIKFYVLARFFVHLFIAIGIWSLLSFVKSPLKYLGYVFTVGAFGVLLFFNVALWKNWISYRGQFTHIDQGDINASKFLQENYLKGESVLLISDPATQIILEGLGGVDSAGGGFMTAENRTLLYQALNAQNPTQARVYFGQIKDRVLTNPDTKLVALSGRTFVWENFETEYRYRFDSNVWSPKELSYWDKLNLLELESNVLKPVYKSDYVWIFELK